MALLQKWVTGLVEGLLRGLLALFALIPLKIDSDKAKCANKWRGYWRRKGVLLLPKRVLKVTSRVLLITYGVLTFA